MVEYQRIQAGDEFLNWNSATLVFEPEFEGRTRYGINAFDGADLIGSLTWSDEGDFIFLRSAYVNPSYQNEGVFREMFTWMLKIEGHKFVDGDWRWGGPLEKFMERYNQEWRENNADA
jgi:hypothetical protein